MALICEIPVARSLFGGAYSGFERRKPEKYTASASTAVSGTYLKNRAVGFQIGVRHGNILTDEACACSLRDKQTRRPPGPFSATAAIEQTHSAWPVAGGANELRRRGC